MLLFLCMWGDFCCVLDTVTDPWYKSWILLIFLWRMLSFIASNDMTCGIPRSCGSSATVWLSYVYFIVALGPWTEISILRCSPFFKDIDHLRFQVRVQDVHQVLPTWQDSNVILSPQHQAAAEMSLLTFQLSSCCLLPSSLGVSSWSLWNSVLSQGVRRSFYLHIGAPQPPWPFSFRIVPVDCSCPNSPKFWPLSS